MTRRHDLYLSALGVVYLGARRLAFWIFVAFQVAIALSGNYGFFNLLAIALCIPLLDPDEPPAPARWAWARRIPILLLLALGTWKSARALDVGLPHVPAALNRWRLAASYGLFANMTTHRHEVVIEGSEDGYEWKEYGFRYKPGDPDRVPAFIQPHMPRVDWMLRFAALRGYERTPWVERLLAKLLDAEPDVLALLGTDPFDGRPPRYVRALLYRYEFTEPDEDGWWTRTRLGLFAPVTWK